VTELFSFPLEMFIYQEGWWPPAWTVSGSSFADRLVAEPILAAGTYQLELMELLSPLETLLYVYSDLFTMLEFCFIDRDAC